MKKALLGVVTAAMILSLGSVSVFAAGPGNGRYFVDTDGDGICDNYGSGRGCGYGHGRNFVDADGDGICDNYGSGWGCGYGRGAQGGRGIGFRGGYGR